MYFTLFFLLHTIHCSASLIIEEPKSLQQTFDDQVNMAQFFFQAGPPECLDLITHSLSRIPTTTQLNAVLPLRSVSKRTNASVVRFFTSILGCASLAKQDNKSFNRNQKLRDDLLFMYRYYKISQCPTHPILPKPYSFNPKENEFLKIILNDQPLFELYSQDKIDFLSLPNKNQIDDHCIISTESSNYVFFQYQMDEAGIQKLATFNGEHSDLYASSSYASGKKNLIFFPYHPYCFKVIKKILPRKLGINYFQGQDHVRVPDFIVDSFDQHGTFLLGYLDDENKDHLLISVYIGVFANQEIGEEIYENLAKFEQTFVQDRHCQQTWVSSIFGSIVESLPLQNGPKKIVTRVHFCDSFFTRLGLGGQKAYAAPQLYFSCFRDALIQHNHDRIIITSVVDKNYHYVCEREKQCANDFIQATSTENLSDKVFELLFIWENSLDCTFRMYRNGDYSDIFGLYTDNFIKKTDYRDQLYKHVCSLLQKAKLPPEEYCFYLAKFFLKHVVVKRKPNFVNKIEEKERMKRINFENDLNVLIQNIEDLKKDDETGKVLKEGDIQKIDDVLDLILMHRYKVSWYTSDNI